MHPAIRALSLWFGGIVCLVTPLSIYGATTIFSVWEALAVLDIFRIATVATLLSFMFPPAYRGANNGDWGSHPEVTIFLCTSLITLPLLMIFPPHDAQRQEIFMDRSTPIYGFMLLWWMHGAINGIHIRILRRRLGLLDNEF